MPSWENSTRRLKLPPSWKALRQKILARDGWQCTWTHHGDRCTRRATDVDHITPGDDHTPSNLRALCSPHHRAKSSSEGGKASARKRVKRARPTESHPGTIKPTRETQTLRSEA